MSHLTTCDTLVFYVARIEDAMLWILDILDFRTGRDRKISWVLHVTSSGTIYADGLEIHDGDPSICKLTKSGSDTGWCTDDHFIRRILT